MANSAEVLQQVSLAANAFANAIRQVTSPPGAYPPGMNPPPGAYPAPGPYYAPQAAPAPRDQVSWGVATPPPPASSQQGNGIMGTLSAFFQAIIDFFRRLFRQGTTGAPVAPATPGAFPAVNPDARSQAFQMFPTGNGLALGFVPVWSQRTGNQIVVSAAGFGQARVWWQGDQLYFQQNGDQPRHVDRITSTRQPSGDTRFDIVLEGGKTVSSELLADGRSIRYQGYTVTLG